MQSTKKIIVVDDDPTTQAILCGSLNAAGYEALEARSGRPVIRMIRQHEPALLITDLVMDDQEGLETITQVRKARASLPIIAISSYDDYLDMAEDIGANAALSKPVQIAQLLDTVAKLISS